MDFLIPSFTDIIDIFIVALILYQLMKVVKETGNWQVMLGLAILAIFYFASSLLGLKMMTSFLSSLKSLWLIALIVLFQPEFRSVITRLGTESNLLSIYKKNKKGKFDEVIEAISDLSAKQYGCILVFEKKQKLDSFIESGEKLDAVISAKLITSIFNKYSALHDGAAIIRGGKIDTVKVVLPLSKNHQYSKIHGTRHLAAIGITEQSDAFCLVVSEETGTISFAKSGLIYSNQSIAEISQRIHDEYSL